MLKRLRRHLNPPMVVATIALFAALGGGYATAFSGSGTLQKAGEVGIDPSAGGTTVDEVRTLNGIGAIGASCNTNSGGRLTIVMRNSSGVMLSLLGTNQNGNPVASFVNPDNNYVAIYEGTLGTDTWQSIDLSVTQVDGTKRPQAHIQITSNETGACGTSSVQVLALNTEE